MDKVRFGILFLLMTSGSATALQGSQSVGDQVTRCLVPEGGPFTCSPWPRPRPIVSPFQPLPIWSLPTPGPAPHPMTPIPKTGFSRPLPRLIPGPTYCMDYIAPNPCPGPPRPILDVR